MNGFHYMPLVPNSKLPAMKDYPKQASRDLARRKKWKERGYGIGYSTSQFGDKEALVVVDVDVKDGKNGNLEIKKLEMLGFEFPETYTQFTPTGGRHLVYKAPKAVKQGTDVLARGLDIRSKGGYVVASGTELSGKTYTDNGLPVAECPQWIIDKCGEAPEKQSVPEATVEIDLERAERRAREYLATAPTAVAGSGGNATTYKVACKLKDFGLAENHTLDLMADAWNPNCQPPWSAHELARKVNDAYRYGVNPVGVDSPEVMFEEAKAPELKLVSNGKDEKTVAEFYLDSINREHALIFFGTGHAVIQETIDSDGKPTTKYLPESSFKRKLSTKLAPQSGKGKLKTWAEEWLDWKGRREYDGLCFSPEREPRKGFYNLWRGFSCHPRPYAQATEGQKRGFDLFIEHARINVCGGNEELFQWLMGYFAHMVQRPYERPLTTLVFKGGKGTGKNSLIDRVGNLLGSGHYLVAHTSRYLTSNFNGHMEACLCLVLDEAFWSGDKASEGQLKGLTTASKIMIEKKGMEPHTVDNLVRIIVIGNEEWLVPASADERRYAVFTVGDGRQKDNSFFHEMRDLIDNRGGNQVLLHYLKNFDLSTVDVNVAPDTAGLHEQKVASLNHFQQWWHDCLAEGTIESLGENSAWPESIATNSLRDAFSMHAKARNIRKWGMTAGEFGKALNLICPSHEKWRPGTGKIRPWNYRLPDLAKARADWDKFIGHKSDWRDE